GDEGEDGALVVGDDADAAVGAVPDGLHDAAAQVDGPGHGGVGVVYGEVRGPDGRSGSRHAGRILADAADLVPVDHEHGIPEAVPADVLVLVAEHGEVERLGRVEVPAQVVVPGQRAGLVGQPDAGRLAALPQAERSAGGVEGD